MLRLGHTLQAGLYTWGPFEILCGPCAWVLGYMDRARPRFIAAGFHDVLSCDRCQRLFAVAPGLV